MDFGSSTILNDILKLFQDTSITGMLALRPEAKYLLYIFAILDLTTTWSLYEGEQKISQLATKFIKIGAFLLLITMWNDINHAIMVSFQHAGLIAAGLPADGSIDIQPSGILDQGFKIISTLWDGLTHAGMNVGKALVYLLTILLILFAYFIMAVQILLTKIEFNVFASIGVILMPFGAFRFTRFLFQRSISCVFAFAVKLMVMYFILGIVTKVAGDPTAIPKDTVEMSVLLKTALSYLVLGFLVWKIPNLASTMVQGIPSLEGTPAVQSMKNAGMGAASQAASMPAKFARAYGNHQATLAAARVSAANSTLAAAAHGTSSYAEPSIRRVAGAYTREKWHQFLANSVVGRNVIRGANNAMQQAEDYANLRSGAYKTQQQKNRNN